MHFVLDENNNKVEAYDKEEVLAVLNQAIADGSLANLVADAAFVTKLKCCVSGQTNKIAFVTQAKYNEMAAAGLTENGVYYYIIDDDTLGNIDNLIKAVNDALNKIIDGTQIVGKAGRDGAGNEIDKTYSKMADAVKSGEFSNVIYDTSTSNQQTVDISKLIPSGKKINDTIGASGTLKIVENTGGTTYQVGFNLLWSYMSEDSYVRGNATVLNPTNNYGDMAVKYIWDIEIEVSRFNNLGSTIKCYSFADGERVVGFTATLKTLNLFFK